MRGYCHRSGHGAIWPEQGVDGASLHVRAFAHVWSGGFAQRGRGRDGIALQSCPPATTGAKIKRVMRQKRAFNVVLAAYGKEIISREVDYVSSTLLQAVGGF